MDTPDQIRGSAPTPAADPSSATPAGPPAGWVKSPQAAPPPPGPAHLGGSLQAEQEASRVLAYKSGLVPRDQAEKLAANQQRNRGGEFDRLVARLRGDCRVWPRYRDAALGDLKLPRSRLQPPDFERYQAAAGELATLLDAPGTLVLFGRNGSGKTHLASALVHAFCNRGTPALFTTASDFYLAIKSTFGEKGRTQEDLVRRFRAYGLLVLDEIEVRSESTWENHLLRDLMNARYSCCVSTVILTNKSRQELDGTNGTPYFSDAMRDRIRDDGGGLVECDWPSLRGAGRRPTSGAGGHPTPHAEGQR